MICALVGVYLVYSGNSLPTFLDNPSVPSSRVKKSTFLYFFTLADGYDRLPETSVSNYCCTPLNNAEQRRSHELQYFVLR